MSKDDHPNDHRLVGILALALIVTLAITLAGQGLVPSLIGMACVGALALWARYDATRWAARMDLGALRRQRGPLHYA